MKYGTNFSISTLQNSLVRAFPGFISVCRGWRVDPCSGRFVDPLQKKKPAEVDGNCGHYCVMQPNDVRALEMATLLRQLRLYTVENDVILHAYVMLA